MAADNAVVRRSAYAQTAKKPEVSAAPTNWAQSGPSPIGSGEMYTGAPTCGAIFRASTIPTTIPAVSITTSKTRAEAVT